MQIHSSWISKCSKLLQYLRNDALDYLDCWYVHRPPIYRNYLLRQGLWHTGFPTGVKNVGGGGGAKSIDGGSMGGLKMLSKDTCEGVHLIVKLPAISLRVSKVTKNELLHTYFSRILARF